MASTPALPLLLSNELSRLSGPGLLESSHTPADFKPVIISSTAPLKCHWLFPAFLPLFFPFSCLLPFLHLCIFIRACGCQHTQDTPKGFTTSLSYQFTHLENGVKLGKDLRKSTTPQTDTGIPLPPFHSTFKPGPVMERGSGCWGMERRAHGRVLKAESEGSEERPSCLKPFILHSALLAPPALSTSSFLPGSHPLGLVRKIKEI